MGHHYAGAVVGPAFGGGAVSLYRGLYMASVFVVIGSIATPVVGTYASLAGLSTAGFFVAMLSASIATSIATWLRIPTSTIQIYGFSIVGVAISERASMDLGVLARIAASWILAPLMAYTISPAFYRINLNPGRALIATMLLSATALGMNDVSNAASSIVGMGHPELLAKAYSGSLMALGLITWGRRLVRTIGGEMGAISPRSYLAAHITKIASLLMINTLGLNASMNQTLVAALARLGAERRVVMRIVAGWIYSPLIGLTISFSISSLASIYL
jgi:PiT family inorganic phosphate transporter